MVLDEIKYENSYNNLRINRHKWINKQERKYS